MPTYYRIQHKRGTSVEWATQNPALLEGELGFETDTRKFKLGDGTSLWNELDYFIDQEDLDEAVAAWILDNTSATRTALDSLDLGGGAGTITSVNGDVGPAVVLDAADVGADAAGTAAAHAALSTGVHGIANTAVLETQSGAQSKADAAKTGAEATAAAADAAHAALTTGVHGIANTAVLETQSGAQSKADAAQTSAESYADGLVDAETARAVAVEAAKADLVGGVIPTSQIPAIAISDVFPVANEAAMLALTAQTGDLAVRTDTGHRYILGIGSPTLLASWIDMGMATGEVESVNGQTGVVVLGASDVGADSSGSASAAQAAAQASSLQKSQNLSDLTSASTARTNIGLGNVNNTSDTDKPVSTAQQAALDAKADDTAVVHDTGDETVAGVKTFSSSPVVPDSSFVIAKVTGLQTALNDKADTGHSHAAADVSTGVFSTARLGSGTANATKYLRGDGAWTAVPRPQTSLPTGAFTQKNSRDVIVSTGHNPVASGRLNFWTIGLLEGDVVSSISFLAGNTSGASLTNAWACIYDLSRNKLAVSDNDTGASWSSSTVRTFTFSTPYTILATGQYYIGLLVSGTTMPTLAGATTPATSATGLDPISCGISTTGLTTPATAPSVAAALTAFAGWAWFYLS